MALQERHKEEIHVLMVAFSAQGHINPMLRLGNRLSSKGLHVSFATTEITGQRMIKSPENSNSISRIPFLFFSDGFSLDYNRKITDLDHYMETLNRVGPINLSNLIKEHYHKAQKKLSCIVGNPFVPWVVEAASELGIPCAMLWIQPCSLYAIYYRFYNKLNPFPTSENPDMSVQLPGLPLLQTPDMPSFVLPSNPFGTLSKQFSEMFQNMKKYKWILANSFMELEKEATESMAELCPIQPIGPLVASSLLGEEEELDAGINLWKPEEACLDWLNSQPPSSVIYISFGSIIVLPAELMEAIATTLKNTKHPFLWVVKRPDPPTPNGDGELPPWFEEETKNQGIIVSWCPQTKVLAHPAISCFMTHCGWSSLLETFVAGVPVVAYPQWTDQPTNAKLVADVLKVGVRLRPKSDGVVSGEEVERSVREIIGGPKAEEFKKNALELKRTARGALEAGGSSDRNIQSFVDEIVGNCRTSEAGACIEAHIDS